MFVQFHTRRISFKLDALVAYCLLILFESIKRACSQEVSTSSIFIFNWVKLNTLRKLHDKFVFKLEF